MGYTCPEHVFLHADHISKIYPGTKALDDVSFDLLKGKVNVLIGENGAGKSTLMKMIAGIEHPSEGKMYIGDQEVSFKDTTEARKHGIGIIHQELSLFPNLNVYQNIFMAREKTVGKIKLDNKSHVEATKKILKRLEHEIDPNTQVGELRVGQQQMIEIARNLVADDLKVLIMDEPTSSITDREVENLFRKIEELKAQGISIIYISHKMEEVFRIADDITVLRDGAVVSTDRAEDLDLDTVIARMVGRKLDNVYPKETVPIGDKALEIKGFSQKDLFEDINFHVAKGEIVGFAGLVGAGRTETMRAIFGLDPHDSGQVFINGKEAKIKCPHDSIQQKMVMLSESRRDDGIIPVRSVMENASLASLERIIYKGYTHKAKEKQSVKESFEKMHVKTPTLDTAISTLSGGNQQKVLLARWLLCEPDIMILDEPTRGIDVGAKFEIYKLITDIVKEGKAVIMVSSELPELIGMCDRIYIMCQGKISGCINREEFSQEVIMRYATGLKNG